MSGRSGMHGTSKKRSRRALWRWSVAAGTAASRLTAGRRALPDFLIVGGQRCGTTSLARALKDHPQVEFPRLAKGVHYFDTGFDHSLGWYRAHFPTRTAVQRDGRRAGGLVRVGEASPYYLFHPDAARRVHATLPDARVVALLRDPVKRAWSQYHHEHTRGFEDLPFTEAIAREPERLAGVDELLCAEPSAQSPDHQHHSYLARGRYAEQLRRYIELLGRERVLVCFSEELFSDPEPVLEQVQHFLGIRVLPLALSRENPSDSAPLPEAVAAELRRHFAEPDAELAELLGRPLPWPSAGARP